LVHRNLTVHFLSYRKSSTMVNSVENYHVVEKAKNIFPCNLRETRKTPPKSYEGYRQYILRVPLWSSTIGTEGG
jgi:hypothetical protein